MIMPHSIVISIVVPIYNAEKYLNECLDSILIQTFADWECILVDDGSTDNSRSICDNYVKNDSRFRLYHKENGGVSSARNDGLDHSHGKYVCFVDSDDILIPEALEILISSAMSENSDIVCANAWRWTGNEKKLLFDKKERTIKGGILSEINHFALWAQLFHLNIIRKHRLRFVNGLAYSEDAVFICWYALYANSMSYVSRPVYLYRINEESACRSHNKERVANHQFEAAREFAKMIKMNHSISVRDASVLKTQMNTRIKLGISAFLETEERFNISYQLRTLNKGTMIFVSKPHFMKLYFNCFYKYCKKKLKEYLKR